MINGVTDVKKINKLEDFDTLNLNRLTRDDAVEILNKCDPIFIEQLKVTYGANPARSSIYGIYCLKIGRLDEGIKILTEVASLQNPSPQKAFAQYILGRCFEYGEGVDADPNKALKFYTLSANQGNASAQFILGRCYELGETAILSQYTAVQWYSKAAAQEDSRAQYRLGWCYYLGHGVEQNYNEAFKWYQLAAVQGNADAQYFIGFCYKNGKGLDQNYNEAFRWYQLAAEQGHATAQNELGWFYDKGEVVEQDYNEAFRWYQSAAEQGQATAQNNLGFCYAKGNGVHQDFFEAVKWYQLAVAQGHADAQNNLNLLYSESLMKFYRLFRSDVETEAINQHIKIIKRVDENNQSLVFYKNKSLDYCCNLLFGINNFANLKPDAQSAIINLFDKLDANPKLTSVAKILCKNLQRPDKQLEDLNKINQFLQIIVQNKINLNDVAKNLKGLNSKHILAYINSTINPPTSQASSSNSTTNQQPQSTASSFLGLFLSSKGKEPEDTELDDFSSSNKPPMK